MNQNISSPLRQQDAPLITRLGNYLSLRILKKVINKVDPNHGKISVLDVGCGYDAQFLMHYANRFSYGIGLDSGFNTTIQKLINIRFVCGDIRKTLFELDQSFDLITSINFIEHVANPLPLIKQMKRMLKPRGVIFLQTGTWLDKIFLETCIFKFNLAGQNGKDSLDEHKMYYNKKDLWKLIIDAGFRSSQIHLKYKKCGLSVTAFVINR